MYVYMYVCMYNVVHCTLGWSEKNVFEQTFSNSDQKLPVGPMLEQVVCKIF